MNVMAIRAGNLAQMRGVGIGLVGFRLDCQLRIIAVTLHADRHLGLPSGRALDMAPRATEPRRRVSVDQKTSSSAGCCRSRFLRGRSGMEGREDQ